MGIYSAGNVALQPLNEVFFGQTPGITRVFDAFSAFRSKYVTSRKFFINDIDADHDPLLADFIKEVEREFGFYSFSFIIEDDDRPNMRTLIPLFRGSDPNKTLTISKDGYRFKPEAKISTITFAPSGLIFNSEYSNREIFAVFLHELGHSFADFISSRMCSLNIAFNVVSLYSIVINLVFHPFKSIKTLSQLFTFSNPVMRTLSAFINKMTIDQKRTVYTYLNLILGIRRNLSTISKGLSNSLSIVSLSLTRIANGLTSGIQSLLDPISFVHKYGGEQLADRFAAYYGFGPDISTALLKMGNGGMDTSIAYYANKIPIYAHIMQIFFIPAQLIAEVFDCHPGAPSRIKGVQLAMENDLKDPKLSPKLRKELKVELDKMNKDIDSYYDKSTKIKNPRFLKQLYDVFIFRTCGGDIKSKAFTSILNHEEETDKMANKLSESTEYGSYRNYIDEVELK